MPGCPSKSVTTADCSVLDPQDTCYGFATGAFTTQECTCNNCGPGFSEPATCSGGTVDLTSLVYADDQNPVSDACALLPTARCLEFVECALNDNGGCVTRS